MTKQKLKTRKDLSVCLRDNVVAKYTSHSYLSVNNSTESIVNDTVAKRIIMILQEPNIIDIVTFHIANASWIFNLSLRYTANIPYPVSHNNREED